MAIQASFKKSTFHFNFRAKTSRGTMSEKDSWFIILEDSKSPGVIGIGEAGPLPGLSPELDGDFEKRVEDAVQGFNEANISIDQIPVSLDKIAKWISSVIMDLDSASSLLFAFETALLDLKLGGERLIFSNEFQRGKSIDINGLIWMGGMDQMLQQIEIKIQEGFNCLKLKVGGIDFERECDILQYVRRKYFKQDIQLRLDANGALKPDEALYKLHELSKFKIHSIEQPIKAGSKVMAELCRNSPIPVALDEELIGKNHLSDKEELLRSLNPKFIILKPSLHGGLAGCSEWIDVAERQKIGWWITSALESNIGLNAIAQFTANYSNPLHQGLGTGKIYSDNFESPLVVEKGKLRYSRDLKWSIEV